MRFNDHSVLEGRHSFLSPSQHHWINDTDEKFDRRYLKRLSTLHGSQQHEFAASAIRLGIGLKETEQTLNRYVNDCIGFRMEPEVMLVADEYCAFGTADAIKYLPPYQDRRGLLRIFDLKTGETPTSFVQLVIYAAFFCIEYDVKPSDIDYEFRIYQSDDVKIFIPDLDDIVRAYSTIINRIRRIHELNREVLT